ncbi:MAG TPA: PQQ-dependent dehydrogenase, methanol/ethanol family [Hyphomicrobiales bacterium]|nr:PQQ-dependent dehydrogenase, methanol/ethanol family [Hyphomicrobiales bacterium]
MRAIRLPGPLPGALLLVLPFLFSTTVLAQAQVDGARMRNGEADGANWLSWGRTYSEQRFSPLTQINDGNVQQLGLAWYFDLDTFRGVEGTPLVVDGVLYTTSAWNLTYALDAATGELLWQYDPEVPRAWGRYACCDAVSRGLAVWEGKVIIATLDGRLQALDARDGTLLWSVQTFDRSWPYTITGAPRVFDGKVLIGNGGADLGVRGFVTAYDVNDGKQLWRFYTVPGDPANGFENDAMRLAATTWNGEWWTLGGGGTVWDSIVYDPALNLVYIGVGNGSPLAIEYRSPGGGDNLFLASIVALDADTGAYVWHYQQVPGEKWDFTSTQPMMLADLDIDGRPRKVLMQAPKNGFFYVLDRATGELLSAREFVPNFWASHVDLQSGRPAINPEADFGTDTVLISPAAGGGHNWEPMSYSPLTGLVYFTVQEDWLTYSVAQGWEAKPFRSNAGWGFEADADKRRDFTAQMEARRQAWLTAWDPVRQREAWRVPHSDIGSGGTLATAGNLVAQGSIDREFVLYSADKGEALWRMDIQNVALAGPISYSVDGEQYIAVNAGWGGGRAIVARAAGNDFPVSSARLLVFKLGGTATLPPLQTSSAQPPRPPALSGSEAQVLKGAELYSQTCQQCHGVNAIGGLMDLRFMTADTHAAFLDIVLGGSREDKGMAGFADLLSRDDADAIHHYLTARANEDWGTDAPTDTANLPAD